jgi:hypothetical protein
MKKISTLILSIFLVVACSDDIGPRGPQGPPGINILGSVYEVTVNFTPQNDYTVLLDFPQDIEVFESDVVLVYLLETTISDSTGPIDVWTLMPRTFYLEDGSAVAYNSTHTFLDVELFLNGSTNLDALGGEFTLDQTFRIAILPADYAENPNIDLADMQQVIGGLQMQQDNFSVQNLD